MWQSSFEDISCVCPFVGQYGGEVIPLIRWGPDWKIYSKFNGFSFNVENMDLLNNGFVEQ